MSQAQKTNIAGTCPQMRLSNYHSSRNELPWPCSASCAHMTRWRVSRRRLARGGPPDRRPRPRPTLEHRQRESVLLL
eukprot:5811800-Pyramimonas_sp.AAC.1